MHVIEAVLVEELGQEGLCSDARQAHCGPSRSVGAPSRQLGLPQLCDLLANPADFLGPGRSTPQHHSVRAGSMPASRGHHLLQLWSARQASVVLIREHVRRP